MRNYIMGQAGGFIAEKHGEDAFWKWADFVFGDANDKDFFSVIQAKYNSAGTENMTRAQVKSSLGDDVKNLLSLTDAQRKEFVDEGLKIYSSADKAMLASVKEGWARGAKGTPTFFVNGVLVPGESSWTLSDWTKTIDPLITASSASTAVGEKKVRATRRQKTRKHK